MANLALAVFLLAFLVPVALHLGEVSTSARFMLVAVCAPFVLLVVLCLMAAARPGSVGRLARRARRTRG